VSARRQISLKQGLLIVVLAALLPVSVASIIQSIASWNAMQRTALYALRANANAIAERERDVFVVANRLLRAAAANPDVRNITGRCTTTLAAGFRGYDPLINFLRTDASARPRCSILPFDPHIDFTGQAWWEKTKRSRQITVSQPTIATIAKVPVIIMAMPLFDARGGFVGTISTGILISQLAESVESAPEADHGSIVIVANNGETVARSGAGLSFDIPMPLVASNGVARAPDGDWMYSIVPLSDQTLYVVYAQPRKKILSAAQSQLRASIIIPLIALILTLAAIWIGTNRLVIRWLAALRRWSNDFKRGSHVDDRTAFANAPLEFKELSDDLHDMALTIEGRTSELTEALAAKTELAREVHHRVKNNLQIVTSLLTMQAGRMTDPSAKTALNQTRARIVALALIHRLSYEQQGEHERSAIAADKLIDELCRQIRQSYRDRNEVELEWQSDAFAMSIDEALPFALFIVEATTNAYRHAFPSGRQGEIKVRFALDGEKASLSVNDNGQGYPDEPARVAELGVELMQGFAMQLNGSLDIRSEPATGTSLSLDFAAVTARG
jgi:two-component sensor histidine kinase